MSIQEYKCPNCRWIGTESDIGVYYDCPKCGKWNKLSDYYKVTDVISPAHWDEDDEDPREEAQHMCYGSGGEG